MNTNTHKSKKSNITAIIFIILTALILVILNGMIYQKESILKNGKTLLLELAPIDPRSLMQGDYLLLRYKISDEAYPQCNKEGSVKGKLVLKFDEKGVATYIRIFKGEPLADREILLNYHLVKYHWGFGMLRLGAENFFFQEGQASRYFHVKYGVLKVGSNGESVLVGVQAIDK